MLHNFGAGNGTVLVHMTHDEHGDLLFLGNSQQTRRALLDLADCTGRRRDVHTAHGLDGVDDYKVRFFLFDQATDLVHIVFGGQKNIVLRHLQAGCTQLDLPDRFFARDIQNAMLIGNGTAQLQQHGGFAHAWLAAQQHNAAQHDAAAQHTVQL